MEDKYEWWKDATRFSPSKREVILFRYISLFIKETTLKSIFLSNKSIFLNGKVSSHHNVDGTIFKKSVTFLNS